MRSALRPARRLVDHDARTLSASIPSFLCPALLRAPLASPVRHAHAARVSHSFSTFGRTRQHAAAVQARKSQIATHSAGADAPEASAVNQSLPRACPGCGAPTQVFDKDEAGFYDIDRKSVKKYLHYKPAEMKHDLEEDSIYSKALKQADPKLLEELGLRQGVLDAKKQAEDATPEIPVCDRCHSIKHHRAGAPIIHPSVEAIQETIWESPHRRNHVYHVIDAADFPLSLVPNLQSALRIPKLRTQNRRAKHKGWVANDRIAEVSFIITRADLLAPKKEQVDRLMPYVQDVLRDALGRANKNARLGNVRLVSAHRGWWTKQVKEDIWDRGGAGWMVGKVNVGKSNLFEVVFPKGRGIEYQDVKKVRTAAEREAMINGAKSIEDLLKIQEQLAAEDAEIVNSQKENKKRVNEALELDKELDEELDEDSLLPPAQSYTPFPVLPIASSLPGTTASPIRIPFGRNRGELIDLPGLARTNPGLETFVQSEYHDDLVMKHRINAERFTLKPGQSLLLGGGLIRLTPITEELIFLVHPFVPIKSHVTRTEKAIDLQAQTSDRNVETILADGAGPEMKSAGRFPLKWDVTKHLAGPLTSKVAGKMKPENLPFRVWSADILIEGVGWVEVSAQVRRPRGWKPVGMVKKDPNHAQKTKAEQQQKMVEERREKFDALDEAGLGGTKPARTEEMRQEEERRWLDEEWHPEIEVFSPLGKFVGVRQPMCGSVWGGPKPVSSRERKARPRRSMASVKHQRKPQSG
ncbi:hypothetical protein BS50DRAFT_578532 [Corynespora cassiicola Philippines]|uniref:Genetic interactor of prohibitins 3, mitochondrial n=1 Tax=Corynespora cassiicola Philippines TaxID=1448308 RepID=A0A2T2N6P3_CORCC|nr:hypothetical protein BS50DRAFT_578532 [Corynespora cassiicola Philippines]